MTEPLRSSILGQYIRNISVAESEADVFQITAHAVNQLLPADRVSISLLCENSNEIKVIALEGLTDSLPLGKHLPYANTLIYQCITHKKVMGWREHCPDYSDVETLYQMGIRTSWVAPLLSASGALGTLNIGSQNTAAFSDHDIELLGQLAALTGSSVEKVRLIQDLSKRVQIQQNYLQRLNVLRAIETELSLAISEDEVFTIMARALRALVPARRISYVTPSEDRKSAIIYALEGDQAELAFGENVPLIGNTFGEELQLNKLHYVPDLSLSRGPAHLKLYNNGMRSALSVGVFVRDQVVGCLNLAVAEKNGFSDEDQALVAALCSFMGTTLERIEIQRLASAELAHQARHDSLTGLVNRAECERFLDEAIAHCNRNKRYASFCFIDVDYFKVVNDSFGHQAGDELLRHVCRCINAEIATHDLLARFGGDEFALLLYNCQLTDGVRAAERIRRAVENTPCTVNDHTINVTLSIGVASIEPGLSAYPKDIIANADVACYIAKEQGRNQVARYSADDKQQRFQRTLPNWLARIREALDTDTLILFAQQIAQTHPADSKQRYELLIRMQDEQGQLIHPGAFIPVAERYGIIHELDHWVITALLRTLATNGPQQRPIQWFINLSSISLGIAGFLDQIVTLLKRTKIPGENFCFEITETAAISRLEDAQNFIRTLKQLGCKFALDDFGTGLSSLSYLKHLSVDYLKIDGKLICDIAHDDVDYALVKAIQMMAETLGLNTVAEHVENDVVKQKLAGLGIDFMQGYGIEKPKPLHTIYPNEHTILVSNFH